MNVTLGGKRDCRYDEVEDPEMGDYPGGPNDVITMVLIRRTQEESEEKEMSPWEQRRE